MTFHECGAGAGARTATERSLGAINDRLRERRQMLERLTRDGQSDIVDIADAVLAVQGTVAHAELLEDRLRRLQPR